MEKQLIKILVMTSVFTFTACDSGSKSAPVDSSSKAMETSSMPHDDAKMTKDMSASMQEKPSIYEESISTLEATVTAIDQATREVTLKNSEGESVSFIADENVKNLAQVEVGDQLTLEYLEAVTVQVFDAEHAEVGSQVVEGVATAEPGEKPGGVAVSEVTVVVVIEAIDKEHESVTLKGPEGNSKTVKVRNPDNLSKVAIGDKVAISYTEAVAISVNKK